MPTAQQAVDDFVIAITKHNPSIYDNLGITINIRTLQGWDVYSSAQSAYFGHGILGRFWAKHIRPWLQPQKHLALRAAYEAEQEKQRQAFVDALLEKWCPEPPKPEIVQVKLYPVERKTYE